MKTKRYSTAQIIGILRDGEAGMAVKDLCLRYGISDATIYNWKSKYGNMSVSEAQRLKELKEENRRLKRLVADQALDIQMLREINSKKW